jgi:hypothetical protein
MSFLSQLPRVQRQRIQVYVSALLHPPVLRIPSSSIRTRKDPSAPRLADGVQNQVDCQLQAIVAVLSHGPDQIACGTLQPMLCVQTTFPGASYWCSLYLAAYHGGFINAACLNVYFNATNQPACIPGPLCQSASLATPGLPSQSSLVSPSNGRPTGATTTTGSTASSCLCPTANIVAGGGCVATAPVFQGVTLDCPCNVLICDCLAGPGWVVSPSCGDETPTNTGCGVGECPAQQDECSYSCGA